MRAPLAAAALFALPALAAAQQSPEEQARRLLEDGRSYRVQGKPKQALDNFNIVVSSFASTSSAGEALLEIGRYHAEVENDVAKARSAFEQVTRDHARSSAAAGAYYNLGLLTLARATSVAEVDDAVAQFSRVEALYPASGWVPRALEATASAHRRAGRYAEAIDAARRVALEFPASDAAAKAQFELGHALALLGQPRLAMEELQQVRNRFPRSEWATPALERITALYRLFGTAKAGFSADPGFALGTGDVLKDVRALATAPDGAVWIASEKTRSAVTVGAGGHPTASLAAEQPRTLSIGPNGEVVLAGSTAVRIGPADVRSLKTPPDKPGNEPKPLENVLAAALTRGGVLLVSDDDRDKVLRFDAEGQLLGTFPPQDSVRRKVTRLLVDGEGAIVWLDRDEKTVRVFEETGKAVRALGPAGLKKPVDVAVDPFRNIYVADEELGVLVFDPQGKPLVTIAGPDLRRPKALTLDPTGAVLVYDERGERVLRYR